MNIYGLQKLTLLDVPDKVACTIFTGGCNFRCPFCHNASLVTRMEDATRIPEIDILKYLEKRKGILEGVCITGGEPMMQTDLESFIAAIRAQGFFIKLDTNGSNSQRLKQLIELNQVDYVAMDIKNTPEKYGITIGVDDCDTREIIASVEYLLENKVPYEFRTTVVREFHKKEDFVRIGEWLKGAEKYYLQSFANSGDLIQSGFHPYTKEHMKQALEIVKTKIPTAEIRGIE